MYQKIMEKKTCAENNTKIIKDGISKVKDLQIVQDKLKRENKEKLVAMTKSYQKERADIANETKMIEEKLNLEYEVRVLFKEGLRMWATIIGLFFTHFQVKFLRNLAAEIIYFFFK